MQPLVAQLQMEIMTDWKEYKFTDFVDINPLISLKRDEYYSYVEMKDLKDGNKFCFPSSERKPTGGARFQNGDTLFAKITPCLENGKICQVKGLKNNVGFGSTEFFVFRSKERISDNEFVFYLSRWDEVRNFAENNFVGTSGRQRVPKNCFENLKVELPDYEEQQPIADILSSLDDKIDLLNRQNKTLEALAETIFRQWFIEEADESFVTGKLADFIEIEPKEKIEREKEYLFFDMKCLANNSMSMNDGEYRIVSSGSTFRKYDTLLAKITPCLENGKTGFVIDIKENEIARGSTEFIVLRTKGRLSPLWVYCLARSNDFRDFAILSMTGTSGRQRVQLEMIRNYEIKFSDSKMTEFASITDEFLNKIKNNQDQIRTLTQLRDTLLPKLMSGEVRVNIN